MKKLLLFSILVVGLLSLFSCKGTQSSGGNNTPEGDNSGKEEVLKVNYRMNLEKEDYAGNFFNWSCGEINIEDKFDATTSASMKKTKDNFNKVHREGGDKAKNTLPNALRGLFFFPVAKWSRVQIDALDVQDTNGIITVKFVHHGKAFKLTTNAQGEFDVLTDSKIAKDVATKLDEKVDEENKYKIKQEFLKSGDDTDMKNLNWDAITLTDDKFSSTTTKHFEGKLKFKLENKVFTITGELKKK